MALPSSYNTGTASVSANSTAVTGQATNWLTSGLQAGDIFVAGGMQAEIASVNSNTSITLADPWPGVTRTTDTYRARFVGDMTRGLTAMNAVLSSITNGILYAFSALASAANKIAYFTGAGTMALADFTAHARAILALSGGNGKFIRSTGTNTAVMQDIVGTVTQSGGVPTGAIIERGSNANGDYVRYADGTQICWGTVNAELTGATLQMAVTYPAAFVGTSFPLPCLARAVFTVGSSNFNLFTQSNTTTTFQLMIRNLDGSTAQTRVIYYVSFGRWFT